MHVHPITLDILSTFANPGAYGPLNLFGCSRVGMQIAHPSPQRAHKSMYSSPAEQCIWLTIWKTAIHNLGNILIPYSSLASKSEIHVPVCETGMLKHNVWLPSSRADDLRMNISGGTASKNRIRYTEGIHTLVCDGVTHSLGSAANFACVAACTTSLTA